jgi:hypothetical protein
MKKIGWVLLLIGCGWLLSSCTTPSTPAANSGNTAAANANAAPKPAAAAPTADALMANDKTATEAWMKGDAATLGSVVSDKFISYGDGGWHGKADMSSAIAKIKCDVKGGGLSEPQATKIDDDTYALVYKNNYEANCTYDGKPMPQAKEARATTIWQRSGDKWLAVFHGENAIIDPKNPPKSEAKKDQLSGKKDDKAAAPALPAKSANTDAVAKVEKSGWEFWRDKDAKKLDGIIAKNIVIIGADGSTKNDRADIIKYWTDEACKDVKNVDVKDPYGITLNANTELLAFTGIADGTCGGQKNMPQPSVSIYTKEDGAWKLAYAYATNE